MRLHGNPWEIENNGFYVWCKLKENKLEIQEEILPSFFYKSFIVKRILQIANEYYYRKYSKEQLLYEDFLLTNKIFIESRKILSQCYPGIKFVILKYNHPEYDNEHPDLWKTLEKEGFIIIETKDLIGREFTQEDTLDDKYHPNEHAWDLVVPKLVEKLGL